MGCLAVPSVGKTPRQCRLVNGGICMVRNCRSCARSPFDAWDRCDGVCTCRNLFKCYILLLLLLLLAMVVLAPATCMHIDMYVLITVCYAVFGHCKIGVWGELI
jgi:hypothetical protein